VVPNEAAVRNPLLLLVLLACTAGFATLRLSQARGEASPAELLAVEEEMIASPADGPVDGVVLAAHPTLPPRFAGLEDELLASPMLHHKGFAEEVSRWVRFWSVNSAEWMPDYLARMSSFEGMVDEALQTRGLPWSLRYLPVIESGYSPTAVSSARAVGMWQFMAATAEDYGVEVNALVDDRRDPFVSTEAAADYLVRLREDFGSWFLALAAYNAGPDRVNGLLEHYLPEVERSDAAYWALRKVFPRETAEFVPNLLGAIIVASDPAAYGYSVPVRTPFHFEAVPVRGSVTFETVARAAGTTREEIARLNPEYLKGRTPPGREVELRLPLGTSDAFRRYFAGDRSGG
jgi:membrane-bound lytic murein transglycosylase D